MGENKLIRACVPELDEVLGIPYKVLDEGFIRVVDYMGSDNSIVQAARVSYGEGTKKTSEDRGLIRYLMRHKHTTPLEMCEIKFHIKVPMDCWRQWIRHRTANVNEYSTRYSIAIDAMQKTNENEWRKQSNTNKQGSASFIESPTGKLLSLKEEQLQQQIKEVYEERIKLGVAREQARKDLSLSTYTEAYWKIDLHNLLHFLALRMDSHAQLEIRNYANIIGQEIVSKWCPMVWEAFQEYRINSFSISKIEATIINLLINNKYEEAKAILINCGFISYDENKIKRNREMVELEKKLENLGIKNNWLD